MKSKRPKLYLAKNAASFILLAFLCLIPWACSKEEPATIRVAGSTTIRPFMMRISELYSVKREIDILVSSEGSMKGLETLIHGKCDMAMCSSPVPPGMLAYAKDRRVQIKGFSFANDLIVPIVHPSNPVNNLSLDQLGKIYKGDIRRWDEVGGRASGMSVVTRALSSGTGEVWKQVVLGSKEPKRGCVVQHSNSGVLAYVAEQPDAIGYVSFALLNHEVKALSVDGVGPTVENARKGYYPISRRLYLYVNEKTLSYDIKSLIVFVLSGKGQGIVKASGFIPQEEVF